MLEVEVLARIIADKMQYPHGVGCRIDLTHKLDFVLVARRRD